jgi:hypothetical protein
MRGGGRQRQEAAARPPAAAHRRRSPGLTSMMGANWVIWLQPRCRRSQRAVVRCRLGLLVEPAAHPLPDTPPVGAPPLLSPPPPPHPPELHRQQALDGKVQAVTHLQRHAAGGVELQREGQQVRSWLQQRACRRRAAGPATIGQRSAAPPCPTPHTHHLQAVVQALADEAVLEGIITAGRQAGGAGWRGSWCRHAPLQGMQQSCAGGSAAEAGTHL